MTPIKHWPAGERPREKLLARGADALSDAELLAIVLRHGGRGQTALDLARDLINRFGSIGRLVLADEGSFCGAPGLGPARFVEMQAMVAVVRGLREAIDQRAVVRV